MKYKAIFFIALSLLISLSACKFQKLIKSGSVDEKYEMAVKLYSQKDYSRAIQLFDQLTGAMRATAPPGPECSSRALQGAVANSKMTAAVSRVRTLASRMVRKPRA